MRRTILVTGGLGFIGSNFVRHLLEQTDAYVANLDKHTYCGNPENLAESAAHPRYRWIKGDIADVQVVEPLMREVEMVVHFAAETHVDRSIADAEAFLRTNVVGTFVLLEAARKANIRRFIHISTDEVYGSVPTGASVETDALWPNSPYAASKAASDLVARSFSVTHHLPVIVTRCSNNFGPYQFPEKALPLLITNALENQSFPLYGSGQQVRDWVYVEDHVRAILLLLEKGVPGEIYNIGGNCALPNHELFARVLSLMGKPHRLIQQVMDRPGHDQRYALNCAKLQALGWSPRVPFDEALAQTIQWYERAEAWWRPIKEGREFQTYYTQQYARRAGADRV